MPNNCKERNSGKTKIYPFCGAKGGEVMFWLKRKVIRAEQSIHCLIIVLAWPSWARYFHSAIWAKYTGGGREEGKLAFLVPSSDSDWSSTGPGADTVSVVIVVIITSMLDSDISGSKISLDKEQLCLHIQISNCNNSEQWRPRAAGAAGAAGAPCWCL